MTLVAVGVDGVTFWVGAGLNAGNAYAMEVEVHL